MFGRHKNNIHNASAFVQGRFETTPGASQPLARDAEDFKQNLDVSQLKTAAIYGSGILLSTAIGYFVSAPSYAKEGLEFCGAVSGIFTIAAASTLRRMNPLKKAIACATVSTVVSLGLAVHNRVEAPTPKTPVINVIKLSKTTAQAHSL